MPEFDLYDDRWHDCWLAATSVARLRKKQVDVNIQQRVDRLLQEHGPGSAKPLSLRIYGTLIKGFCVINNERLRALFCDCERVVLMFARQPFAEGDNKIRLPAAKRPKLEAKWVQMALADGPSFQEFDWTQAPLEEGALLRLGGGAPQELMPLSLDFGASHDGLGGAVPPLLQPAGAVEVLAPSIAAEGWLPRVGEEALQPELPEALAVPAGPPDLTQSQLVPLEPCGGPLPPDAGLQPPPGPEAMLQAEAGFEALAQPAARKAREPLVKIKPGTVYGFDNEPVMASTDYDAWQQDSSDLSNARMRATSYAAQIAGLPESLERLGPRLCLILEPDGEVLQRLNLSFVRNRAAKEQQQQLPGRDLPAQQEVPAPPGAVPPAAAGGAAGLSAAAENPVAAAVVEAPPPLPPPWEAVEYPHGPIGAMGPSAEGQEDRTAEVGKIIRGCLRSGSDKVASFAQLVPPAAADRATAACTFAALLALATAGELRVEQAEPYSQILVSEAPLH